jgi:hypothetical protein
VIRTLFCAALAAVTLVAAVATSGCGESSEKRMRSARPVAERYFEYIKVGDYEGAFRHTLASSYRAQMQQESFVQYRQMLAATTGPIAGASLVESTESAATGRVRLVYTLDSERLKEDPPREVLDLERERGEWRIAAIDVKMPKAKQAGQPQDLPLPGPRNPAPAPPAAPANR